MIFVIGGFAAGKRQWVEENLGYTPAQCSRDWQDDCPVLYDLQDLDLSLDHAMLLEKKIVVIANEIGCGLVPVNPADRARREQIGRLCTHLASQACCVVRVVCGVGVVIKGALPCTSP